MYLKKWSLAFVIAITFLFTPLSVYAASTESIYVLVKIEKPSDLEPTVNNVFKFGYSKSGLLTSRKESWYTWPSETMKSASASYTYSKKNLLATNKYKNLGETSYRKDTYKFDKKGRVKSINGSTTLKYNKKGYLAKVPNQSVSYTYNDKGLLSTVTKGNAIEGGTYYYYYDSHDQVIKKTDIYHQTNEYKNQYNSNGLLVKQTDKWNKVTKYKYKKIKVSKKDLEYIKAQQKYLFIYYGMNDYYYLPLEGFYK